MEKAACQIETVRLWLKVFIPRNIEGAELVTVGKHKGKTMLSSPGPIDAWFLTDERDFDASPEAQARMHSEILLDFKNYGVLREYHHCGPTIQLNRETGEEECHEMADTKDMQFHDFQMLPQMRTISMKLSGSGKNACLKVANVRVSPNVDYEGELSLRLHQNLKELTVRFHGQIEVYPAFEMYLTINDGAAVTVFQMPVEAGAGPLSLVGPPKRPITASVTTAC